RVDLQIVDLGDDQVFGGAGANADQFWDGVSSFTLTSSTTGISATGQAQTPWGYDNPDNMWLAGHTYQIRATAVDALGNKSITQSTQFIYDSSAPLTVSIRPA